MYCDFSQLNLQYLIQARDMAREDPDQAAVLLGIDLQLAKDLANVTPAALSIVTKLKVPVIGPLPQTLWWQRFLRALNEGKTEEAEVILEHANLVMLSQHSVSNHDE